jgi:OOP family OmpA-OmpF porin
VTLKGAVGSDRAREEVVACVASFAGTRVVDDRLRLLEGGRLEFLTGYDRISIAGVVPSESARAGITDRAVDLWGESNVIADLEVDTTRTVGGRVNDDFRQLLETLHHSRRELDIRLSGGQAVVRGSVLSELAKLRVLGAAVAALPGFEVVDRLVIRPPASDRETLQKTLDELLAGRVVEFATDSGELTSQGRGTLDEVVAVLRSKPGKIEISGHTDSTGTPQHNLELSRRRAEAAAAYLVANGVQPARFTTIGYGRSRPIASNATDDGRQANRRTEFHAVKEN